MTTVETLIIGAGQAGLALSRLLAEAGHDHVVLERGRIGERWRSERWDSLALLTPNWANRLPLDDAPDDPDAYLSRAEFVATLRPLRPLVRRAGARTHDRDRGRARRGRLPRAHRPRRMARAQRRASPRATARCRRCRGSPPRRRRRSSSCTRRAIARRSGWRPGGVLVVGAGAERSPDRRRARPRAGAAWCSPSAATSASSVATGAATSGPGSTRSGSCRGRGLRTSCRPVPRQPRPALPLDGRRGGRTLDLGVLAAAGVRIAGRLEGFAGDARAARRHARREHRRRRRAAAAPAAAHRRPHRLASRRGRVSAAASASPHSACPRRRARSISPGSASPRSSGRPGTGATSRICGSPRS